MNNSSRDHRSNIVRKKKRRECEVSTILLDNVILEAKPDVIFGPRKHFAYKGPPLRSAERFPEVQ